MLQNSYPPGDPLRASWITVGFWRRFRLVIPERAFGVKGLPVDFFAYVPRQSHVGPFGSCLDCVQEPVVSVGCRGHVLRGFSRRSFRVRRHPYPSLRESARLPAVVQAHADLIPSILVRPSRGRRPSQSKRRSATKPSHRQFQTGFHVHEGIFFPRKKGRCNRAATTRFPVSVLRGFPIVPCVL
jgi:hypothetical protein